MAKPPTNIRAEPGSVLAIARRCLLLRKAIAKDNQAEFARRLGIGRTLWNSYERANSRIGLDTAAKIRALWGVPTDWIYFGDYRWMPAELMDAIRRVEAEEAGLDPKQNDFH